MKLILTIALSLLVAVSVFAETVYKDISQQTLLDASKDEFLIIDVRRPSEFAEGHVPNAINIPLSEIEDATELFEQGDKPIVMYCRSGKRANKALNIMHERGYSKLHHLDGDMSAWLEAELPVEMPEQ